MASVMQACVLLLCFLPVMWALSPLSWQGKVVETRIVQDHDHKYEYKETNTCVDKMSTKRCKEAERRYKICGENRGNILCAKTCHVCHLKALSPEVPCNKTVLGCCWDGKTRKRGLSNEGCPDCEDDDEFAGLCRRWRKYCHRGTNKDVMEKYCHRTCGKCQDEQKTVVRKTWNTLPPVLFDDQSTSVNSPRRGAMYVWTKVID